MQWIPKIFKSHPESPHEPKKHKGIKAGFKIKFGGDKNSPPVSREYMQEALDRIHKNRELDLEVKQQRKIDKAIRKMEKAIQKADRIVEDITADTARSPRG